MNPAGSRIVRCFHCSGLMRVTLRALSVFCPHCQRRLTLEDLRIVGSHPGRELATCGDIVIEKSARLVLPVMGENIRVFGAVTGNVTARQMVEVAPTGRVLGDIRARKIVIHEGAVVRGRCHVVTEQKKPGLQAPVTESTSRDNASTDEGRELAGVASPARANPVIRPIPLPPPQATRP